MASTNAFGALSTLSTSNGDIQYYSLNKLEEAGLGNVSRLPYSIRVLLEALLRNVDGFVVNVPWTLVGWTRGRGKVVLVTVPVPSWY